MPLQQTINISECADLSTHASLSTHLFLDAQLGWSDTWHLSHLIDPESAIRDTPESRPLDDSIGGRRPQHVLSLTGTTSSDILASYDDLSPQPAWKQPSTAYEHTLPLPGNVGERHDALELGSFYGHEPYSDSDIYASPQGSQNLGKEMDAADESRDIVNGWADEQPRDYEVLSRYSDGQNYALFPHNALDPKLLAGYQQADETIEQYDQSEDEGEEYDTVASQVATGSTPFLNTYEDPLRDSSAAETFQENVERAASQFEFTFSFPSPVQLDDAVRRSPTPSSPYSDRENSPSTTAVEAPPHLHSQHTLVLEEADTVGSAELCPLGCGETVSMHDALYHVKKHHRPPGAITRTLITCPLCTSNPNLQWRNFPRHVQSRHYVEKVVCPCGKKFARLDAKKRHWDDSCLTNPLSLKSLAFAAKRNNLPAKGLKAMKKERGPRKSRQRNKRAAENDDEYVGSKKTAKKGRRH